MTLALDSTPHCERDNSPGDCDIEITSRMIKAGKSALASHDPNDDAIDAVTLAGAARAVFVAMVYAQREAEGTFRRSSLCAPKESQ
jgi:hypothetical protein